MGLEGEHHRPPVGHLLPGDCRKFAGYNFVASWRLPPPFNKVSQLSTAGKFTDEVAQLKGEDPDQFRKVFDEASFKWFDFCLRVKMEMYNAIDLFMFLSTLVDHLD